jgi:leader peptidase (prepilin peptidase)/N-methyltransferase
LLFFLHFFAQTGYYINGQIYVAAHALFQTFPVRLYNNLMLLTSFETILGLPDYIGYIFFFVLGSVIGSFLNVVIHRIPAEESIVFPDSACPKCKAKIKPYDNIPILSWLILGGKCRKCKNPISFRYPVVELITAVLFTLVFWRFDLTPIMPVYLIFAAAITALIFIDAEHMILPNVITYPGMIFAFLVRLIFPLAISAAYFTDLNYPPLAKMAAPIWAVSLIGAVLGALAGGGSLWLIGKLWKILRGVDGMGLGDVKMMFAVGALFGWRLTFLTLFLSAATGAVGGIIFMIVKKEKSMQTQIPFGIFLGIGSLIAMLFGDAIITWYLANFVR